MIQEIILMQFELQILQKKVHKQFFKNTMFLVISAEICFIKDIYCIVKMCVYTLMRQSNQE